MTFPLLDCVAEPTLCLKHPFPRKGARASAARSCCTCCAPVTLTKAWLLLRERKQLSGRVRLHGDSAIGEEPVPDDLGLLFQSVAAERPSRLHLIGIAAEGMAHQRKVERAPA